MPNAADALYCYAWSISARTYLQNLLCAIEPYGFPNDRPLQYNLNEMNVGYRNAWNSTETTEQLQKHRNSPGGESSIDRLIVIANELTTPLYNSSRGTRVGTTVGYVLHCFRVHAAGVVVVGAV